MHLRSLFLPALCLGGAALLFLPTRSQAFSKIGGSLGETQRDVRVFDNFVDPQANDNLVPASQFPGWLGVELAIWKAIVEWGSQLHGDGSGDPQGGNQLGSGGANFDAFWAGAADGIGGGSQNIVSALSDCGGGGTLAYTETPISDGWRIRFCDNWTWDDGPGVIGSRFDVQGVMAHEYGHALGLGHSALTSATMAPSVGPGQTSIRSIEQDDVDGVQCIYGIASVTKPVIRATVAGAGTLTIHGSQFGASDNEVWFTSALSTPVGADPIVRVTGVGSAGGGTAITVLIPPEAGPGDVLVNKPGSGGATLSNAFPTDLQGTFGSPPAQRPLLRTVTPSTLAALLPGPAQTVTLSGSDLDLVTAVLIDGVPLPAASRTLVDAGTLTFDMPQVGSLGAHTLTVSDGFASDELALTVVAPALPTYELGQGLPLGVVDRDDGLRLRLAGPVGSVLRIYVSGSDQPSVRPQVSLDIGNGFKDLVFGGQFTIPAAGWLQLDLPPGALPDPGAGSLTFHSQLVRMAFPLPLAVSNAQSMILVQ